MLNSIHIKTGTEGPKHDPYAYEELVVKRPNGTVTLHEGLGVWCKLEKIPAVYRDENALVIFEQATGITPATAKRVWCRQQERPLREHNARCKGRNFSCVSGYPGETFAMCTLCGEVVDSHFDRSAIE